MLICLIAGFVSWTEACGCSSLEHMGGFVDFSELARALKVLRTHRPQDWSDDDIISIIDELISKPHLDYFTLDLLLPSTNVHCCMKPSLNYISCCMQLLPMAGVWRMWHNCWCCAALRSPKVCWGLELSTIK